MSRRARPATRPRPAAPAARAADEFAPLGADRRRCRPETAALLDRIDDGRLAILPLFRCDRALFARVRREAMSLTCLPGDAQSDRATTAPLRYRAARRPRWRIPAGTYRAFHLWNASGDLRDGGATDARQAGARFAPGLRAIPEFLRRYFGRTEPANCRLLTIDHPGELGDHREPILGIPGRPRAYKLRFHLPCATSPRVLFRMNDVNYTMRAGIVYFYNQSCLHGVENVAGVARAHLVFDCWLNEHILHRLVAPALAARDVRAAAAGGAAAPAGRFPEKHDGA